MLTLLKNLHCFAPEDIGKNDILICNDKIYKIQPSIDIIDKDLLESIYNCEGLYAFPGIIDQHVHITGGGGESGFTNHISEIDITKILKAGVTTLVGLLGADSYTRSLESLYAKAKAIEAQGITTYVYIGSYVVPPVTFTGNITKDLILIDKAIGVGEIAISDHRSSHAKIDAILKIASDAYLGGLLSGKAGVTHLHLGDGKDGLTPLIKMLKNSDLPVEQFIPTHLNRNEDLFFQGVKYCKKGGYIDITSGEKAGVPVPEAVKCLAKEGVDWARVTVSSDANGSIPSGGISDIQTIYDDIFQVITEGNISTETAISLVTKNVAKLLKLFPQKGTLLEGSDADIIITDEKYNLIKLFGSGKLLLDKD